MKGVAVGVAVVATALYFVSLGVTPFVDPPEGFHAAIARDMATTGDLVTPRLDGVRYFDKPPLLHWLMAGAFRVLGVTPFAARLTSALAAVGVAAVTAWIGVMLGGPRLGLLAGLIAVTNLGMFLFGRIVKPDLLFILTIMLAFAGFTARYRGGGRWALALMWSALALAAIAKDPLGAVGPAVAIGMLFWLTRERPLSVWTPWWGGVLALAIAVPWYLAVDARNPGFLWYFLVDNHVLNFTRQRAFPDEDVPLTAIEFLAVTAMAFMPWALAVPAAITRTLRRPWEGPSARLWLLFAIWPLLVLGFFVASPFKLPHYGLPAFPALALLTARVWDDAIERASDALPSRTLLAPILAVFAVFALAFVLGWADAVPLPRDALRSVDVASRNLAAHGVPIPSSPLSAWRPMLAEGALIFALGAVAMAIATWRRATALGVGVAMATMVAFLPVAGEGMAQYGRTRAATPIVEALAARLGPDDVVVHEGPLENTGSLLLAVHRPVHVVNGRQSNLAFGATFPEAANVFWDGARLREAWSASRRCFLVSVVPPEQSVVRRLPADSVRLLAERGGRWLYSNHGD